MHTVREEQTPQNEENPRFTQSRQSFRTNKVSKKDLGIGNIRLPERYQRTQVGSVDPNEVYRHVNKHSGKPEQISLKSKNGAESDEVAKARIEVSRLIDTKAKEESIKQKRDNRRLEANNRKEKKAAEAPISGIVIDSDGNKLKKLKVLPPKAVMLETNYKVVDLNTKKESFEQRETEKKASVKVKKKKKINYKAILGVNK